VYAPAFWAKQGYSVEDVDKMCEEENCKFKLKWRAILDNLRNFFLSPPAEMLSFLQQLRQAF
jgi:hypothetical protein